MAVSVQEAHDFIRMIIKKNKLGFVSPKDIDRVLNRAVQDWVGAKVSKFHQSKTFDYDHLMTKRVSFTVTNSTSVQSLPNDYLEALTVYSQVGTTLNEGSVYGWDSFLEVTGSKIIPPTVEKPAANIYIDENNLPKIQFAPIPTSGSYTFILVYVPSPVKCVYNYTTSNGNISFNPTGSVDIAISERFMGDIYARAFMYLGIPLTDEILLQTERLRDGNQLQDKEN